MAPEVLLAVHSAFFSGAEGQLLVLLGPDQELLVLLGGTPVQTLEESFVSSSSPQVPPKTQKQSF